MAAFEPKLEVGYWAIRGLGAPCRMICAYSGADYEAKCYEAKPAPEGSRHTWDLSAWLSVKPALQERNALINLPYVIDGDVVLTQTIACMTYLGRKFDLMGPTLTHACKVEQILNEVQDLRNAAVKLFYGGDLEGMRTHLQKSVGRSYAKFEGWLSKEGTLYTVGAKPTAGDFHLWEMLDEHELLASDLSEPSPLASFPKLSELYAALRREPQLAAYFAGPLYALPVNNVMAKWGAERRVVGTTSPDS